jgi:hypothetical protein
VLPSILDTVGRAFERVVPAFEDRASAHFEFDLLVHSDFVDIDP